MMMIRMKMSLPPNRPAAVGISQTPKISYAKSWFPAARRHAKILFLDILQLQ